MLLTVDVGNTNIVLAIWNGKKWISRERIETHPVDDTKRVLAAVQTIMNDIPADGSISCAIISSVVPPINRHLQTIIEDELGFPPIVLSSKTDTGITLAAEHPEKVGADLIADAAGAYGLVQDTCIVVDFGTATTVMSIEKPGVLVGGAICAGLKVSVEALIGKTAQLQDIPLEIPESPLGKNTIEAMQSGLVLGHLCMVEGLVDRMKAELGSVKVVATGGLVSLFKPHTNHFDYVEPMLTLDGLRIIAERQGSVSSRQVGGRQEFM